MIHRWEYGEKFTMLDPERKEQVQAILKTDVESALREFAILRKDTVLATRICKKCGKKMVGWVGIGIYCFGLKDYACSWTEVEPDKQEKRDIRLKQLGI